MARRSPAWAYRPDTAKHAPCPGCGVVTDSAFDDKDGGVRSSAGKGSQVDMAGDGRPGAACPPLFRRMLALVRDVLCHPVGANQRGAPGE